MRKFLSAAGVIAVMVLGCSKDKSSTITCTGESISYASKVAAVMNSNCATSGCHDAGSRSGPGALVTYSQIFNARSSIKSSIENGSMPRKKSMSEADKQTVVCWINNGAPNN